MRRILRIRMLILMGLVMALAVSMIPARTQTAHAQAGISVVDQVLILISRNLGIYPAPTSGQLSSGDYSFNADMSYELIGLDLRDTPLSCTARQMGSDEQIIGTVGYLVRVQIQDRVYEYRTNQTGTKLIRCQNGQEVDLNFGAQPNAGRTLSGDEATVRVIDHLNDYLSLDPPMTFQEVIDFTLPYRAGYTWTARIFTSTSMGCPARGATYTTGDMFGYRINFTVKGYRYLYLVRGDGGVIVLCRNGLPDASSIGFFEATTTTTP